LFFKALRSGFDSEEFFLSGHRVSQCKYCKRVRLP
jgi:hypothetical protein